MSGSNIGTALNKTAIRKKIFIKLINDLLYAAFTNKKIINIPKIPSSKIIEPSQLIILLWETGFQKKFEKKLIYSSL